MQASRVNSQTISEPTHDILDCFLPPVAGWFRSKYPGPTPPQRMGWPVIARGSNSLIVAPTGSGKTLAAFLACLDTLWRTDTKPSRSGVRVLYVSPLKALNADIARNLECPLAEIREYSQRIGQPLRSLSLAVRTGDTSQSDRQRMRRKPPDILITTPESLHLLLTSGAREMLRSVGHLVLDEIHALCGNKRGVFLSLLLERLERLCPKSFVRVGLSATQRPLDEVARYLAGRRRVTLADGSTRFEPRPVEIIDAGCRKEMELRVSMPGSIVAPGGSIWPAIEEQLYQQVVNHHSTIVFTNNRRVAERLAAALNERAEQHIVAPAESAASALEENPAPPVVARPHHGSLSMQARQSTEEALKRGEIACVVATASLELGIDMGSVELVCQVESPGGIARGLQRVGRAGHVVGAVSRGHIYAKTCADLLESAALARGMIAGEVEPLRVPQNCLDVLAQQVVACVAVDRWDAAELFDLMRQAYPYRDLTPAAFEGVLSLVSGRFGFETFRDLKPRISWDRVHNVLLPLPGSAQLALVGGGTIPDTGQYPLFLGEGGPRLGELDEEFVLERRVGEAFRLGHGTWRIEAIEPHRVIVSPAEGHAALVPFWRGEGVGRTPELGEAVGALCRELVERLVRSEPQARDWLQGECHLDRDAAHLLGRFVLRQNRIAGAVPDDRTLLVETFVDPAGETGLAVLCPLGSRVNHALKIILQARLRRRYGLDAAALHGDDGILLRLPGMDDPPLDLFEGLTPDLAEELLREELGDTPLFGLRFRQNACRALLMPRPEPGRRAPLWLQRLRARDLLQTVRRFPSFPIVVETYRECLDDDLELSRVKALLQSVCDGRVRVVARTGETPSPLVSELIFRFTLKYLYEWDDPKPGDRSRASAVDDELLDGLLANRHGGVALDPDAVARVDQRLRGVGRPPRTIDEMAEWLRQVGDIAPGELVGPMHSFLSELHAQGRAMRIELDESNEFARWIGTEEHALYGRAFGGDERNGASAKKQLETPSVNRDTLDALAVILRRFLHTRALVGLGEVLARYPIDPALAREVLEDIVEEGDFVRLGGDGADGASQWANRRNLADARRLTLALRRRESVAIPPEAFADFLLRHHHVHPRTACQGEAALPGILARLEGYAAPLPFWEAEILARRVQGFRPGWLDAVVASGTWIAAAGIGPGRDATCVAFLSRDFVGGLPFETEPEGLPEPLRVVHRHLLGRGACYVEELSSMTGMSPSAVREALAGLHAAGLVVADRLDPLRPGADQLPVALADARARVSSGGRPRLGSRRRGLSMRPEPRWSASPLRVRDQSDRSDKESNLLAWANVLLERHGVLSRETVSSDPWAPAWRELAGPLSCAELRGEIRRGYFVQGLSGLQFALPETADTLARYATSAVTGANDPPVLINACDPANLYGQGAPFDIPLLEGGSARLSRIPSNYLVLHGGRPVLVIEAHGKRLTGLGWASQDELAQALALLPSLAHVARRVLKVETYDAEPVLASPVAALLSALGFVRDPPGLAYYARWDNSHVARESPWK